MKSLVTNEILYDYTEVGVPMEFWKRVIDLLDKKYNCKEKWRDIIPKCEFYGTARGSYTTEFQALGQTWVVDIDRYENLSTWRSTDNIISFWSDIGTLDVEGKLVFEIEGTGDYSFNNDGVSRSLDVALASDLVGSDLKGILDL